MDLVTSVCSLIDAILEFINNHDGVKCPTILQIASLLTQIEKLVVPLLVRKHLNLPLRQYLEDLEGCLMATRGDLRAWHQGRSNKLHTFLTPRSAPRELKDDREFLIRKHATLSTAVQISSHVKGYNIVCPTSSIRLIIENKSVQSLKMKMKGSDADQTSLFEASQFWKCYIGDETEFADSEDFCEVLSLWLDEPLSDLACRRLLLRLDEHSTGYISFSTFQEFIRNGNLRETVHLFTADPHLPLLVWIDDDITGNIHKLLDVSAEHTTVVQLVSTAAAKAWVNVNHDFLKKYDDPAHIRFTSNQILEERNDYHVKVTNDQAGLQITSHIRDIGIKAPILIYTTKANIGLTRYVEDYDMVGSLGGNSLIFHAFVAALAGGRKDDSRWIRYNA
ncbi:unnamed protein product [Cyclocybe aegerita]|uniref:EF-hand domain-containing protein n=1 Tax=Cyclocybe aegerita TaxID=1973307 RepID=A0A8S0WIR8_CYCAE|nr:unnamed protein product [Cyclocybe aegerita]